MQIIKGRNINQLVMKTLKELKENGYRSTSRNGDITAIYDVSLKFENPRSRHLNLDGRTNNIFATLAEILWVMAGETNVIDYLSYFIPRAPNYSDDGVNWYSSYGDRMYRNNQLQNIVDIFKEDGKYTRRATLSIFDPNTDTLENYKKATGGSVSDIACNQWINFFITPDDKLNMKVLQRSGDIIFGTGNINLPEFSVLQELILQQINETYPEVTLGYYNQSVTNLHLYDFNGAQAIPILQNNQILTRDNHMPCIFPRNLQDSKKFFKELVQLFTVMIKEKTGMYESSYENITEIFDKYEVECENNMIFGYCIAIRAYIMNKYNGYTFDIDPYGYSDEFTESLKNNYFNKGVIKR